MSERLVAPGAGPWLLLIHQVPPKPDYLRVKIGRRLQRLGAIAVKNAVYALPASDEALEDLHWVAAEILEGGGDAIICRAEFLAGVDESVLRSRLAERVRGGTWVTRENVFVDRIASAWLIARYIDPDATFRFVPATGYRARRGELRFDMFEGEFTHVGDRCTSEVLVERFALHDPVLVVIAEIVHDLDLKDEKFGRAESAEVLRDLTALVHAHASDADRIVAGRDYFDALYARLAGA